MWNKYNEKKSIEITCLESDNGVVWVLLCQCTTHGCKRMRRKTSVMEMILVLLSLFFASYTCYVLYM